MSLAVSPCPDCGSDAVRPSAVPGLGACNNCGQVYPVKFGPEEDAPTPTTEPLELDDYRDLVVPDAIECAIGYRAWGIDWPLRDGEPPVLQSVAHGQQFWIPGKAEVATCDYAGRSRSKKEHEVPEESCSCGLYSAKTYEHLTHTMTYHHYDLAEGMVAVVGRVKLWGKVREGSLGWRALYGYPETIYVPFEAWSLAPRLEQTYMVPVRLRNTLSGE